MVYGIAVFFLVYCYWDMRLLFLQDESLFRKVFVLSKRQVFVLVLLSFLVLAYGQKMSYVAAVLAFLLFPAYLIKRIKFRRRLDSSGDRGLVFASDAFSVGLYWFAGEIIFGSLIKGLSHLMPAPLPQLSEIVIVALFSFVFLLFLIVIVVRRHPEIQLKDVFAWKTNNQPIWKLVVVPAGVSFGFALFACKLILSRSQQPFTPFNEAIQSSSSFSVFMAFLTTALILAPFFEELSFRGFLFYSLKKYKGQRIAVLAVAVIFGLFHFHQYWGDWVAILMVTIFGFILTILRAQSGSIIPSIIAHYVFNGAMTILPVIMVVISNPSYYSYQVNFAELDSQEKEQLLLTSIRESPQNAQAYNDLAWLYAQEKRNLSQALRMVDRALGIMPETYAFLDTKAEVLFQQGRYQEAVEIGQRLSERYPDDPYAQKQLAKFLKALED